MSGTTSPNPPPIASSPLFISRSFIKQYYHILATNPSQIHKFYKPDSQLSFGKECNIPSDTHLFSALTEKTNELFDWAENATVDFEHGSIDAQASAAGGILLVVTGHMKTKEHKLPRRFVHTFFLCQDTANMKGSKRHFYVLNDVFRFLSNGEEVEVAKETATENQVSVTESNISVEDEEILDVEEISKEDEELKVTISEKEPEFVTVETEPETVKEEEEQEEKVETKAEEEETPYFDEEDALDRKLVDAAEYEKMIIEKSTSASLVQQQQLTATDKDKDKAAPLSSQSSLHPTPRAAPKPPGSWASLVAGGGGAYPTNSKSEEKKTTNKKDVPAPRSNVEIDTSATSSVIESTPSPPQPPQTEFRSSSRRGSNSSGRARYSYNNDNNSNKPFEPSSLYIKNVGEDLKESDLRALFGTYGHKIVNVNLYPSRGFAFVDFAESAAVTDIMKEPRSFIVNGRPLEVEKKSGRSSFSHRSGNGMSSMGRGGRYMNSSRRSNMSSSEIRRSNSSSRTESSGDNKEITRMRSSSGGDRRKRSGRGGVMRSNIGSSGRGNN